jgi:hypothetical protein
MSSALGDELLAIEAIYPGYLQQSSGAASTYRLQVDTAELYISFPEDYPQAIPKISSVSGIARNVVEKHLEDTAGEEVLYSLINVILEHVANTQDEIPLKESSASSQPILHGQWIIGEPVHDRKSTMLGRAIKITSNEELAAALECIKQDKHLQKAAHPQIWAARYRQVSEDGSERIIAEHDDDGETGAGSRLAFLLEVTKATDVLVVVTRWFGGILLGDVRFKHISTAARDALDRGEFLS